jgi:preprotein translocase subunit SecA
MFDYQDPDRKEIEQTVSKVINEYVKLVRTYEEDRQLQGAIKHVMLIVIDQIWIRHLENMTRLKEGIGIRQYQQEDPMRLYQKEGLELFENMYNDLEKQICKHLANLIRSSMDQ